MYSKYERHEQNESHDANSLMEHDKGCSTSEEGGGEIRPVGVSHFTSKKPLCPSIYRQTAVTEFKLFADSSWDPFTNSFESPPPH